MYEVEKNRVESRKKRTASLEWSVWVTLEWEADPLKLLVMDIQDESEVGRNSVTVT